MPYASFDYRTKSWDRPHRVAKVEWHAGELFPRADFIAANLNRHAHNVVSFYNGRGTAARWIRQGKYALKWTRLSCRRFVVNAVRLQRFALAYNLANFLRRLALPRWVRHWSLTTLWEKLIKTRARIVRHARYVTYRMAEVAVHRTLFEKILARVARLMPLWRGTG